MMKRDWILNCDPSKDTQNDWILNDAVDAGILDESVPLPASINLREDLWTINDQKNTGSCVGWALADSVLRWHFTKAGRLSEWEMMSPRFIWMASKETDIYISHPTTFLETSGTSLKAALDIARKYGAVPESELPFQSGDLYSGKPQTFYAIASRYKILSYFSLGRDPQSWREWLAFNGPIMTRLDVDEAWYGAGDNQGNLDKYSPPASPAGHAVALVGYTSDRFIVRNSWGTDWGDKGFAFASESYARDAFTETYGVVV